MADMANLQFDDNYEFSAPRFFDFLTKETEEQISKAERWFESSLSDPPSPFMPKIRVERLVQMDCSCEFGEVENAQKPEVVEMHLHKVEPELRAKDGLCDGEKQMVVVMEIADGKGSFGFASEAKPLASNGVSRVEKSSSTESLLKSDSTTFAFPVLDQAAATEAAATAVKASTEILTPKVGRVPMKETAAPTNLNNQTAKKISTSIKKSSSAVKPASTTPARPTQNMKPEKGAINSRSMGAKMPKNTDISQENQAIKRQKLDEGRFRQIHNVKIPVLLHKSKPFLSGSNDLLNSEVKICHEQRKELATYISTAEMIEKFQSKTREIDLPHNNSFSQGGVTSMVQRKPKLMLTRPREPTLETAHRARAVRIKSSAELEEEMLAKMPRFKARPLNKKILEAPSLPAPQRSVPQPPDIQEFHLKTMERANQHVRSNADVCLDNSYLNQIKPLKLTEPRPPVLETTLRARPIKIKSSQELELEELEKIPKFKARPLNKKILESKGDLGLFCQSKPQVTTPREFHFATNDRLGPPPAMVDLFDKLSLHSESSRHSQQDHPRITKPSPFHLHTEERGAEKEKLLTLQILQKQLEEEAARIPKANPYPYTTDYPVMPPKPQPKQCTKPEVFQLESLTRHEEVLQKMKEDRTRMEMEEAEKRIFKAQPILKEDPLPLPDRERKPLTEVQEFVLQVDHRAAERSKFDQKVKEKELAGKRYREEQENAKMIEEEKEVKQMRRTMVPHARPVPKFDNPFHPQKSTKEKTKPKSPKLHVKQRERNNKTLHSGKIYMR
ncbi:hypothetical protein HPP92_012045 [Vanilla planifolia]|uniref:Targeting protein for Xklp2 n=1 Tax=Vanilla planifolia TaxID=51239 RepID=A0A835R772_VANPL|nr:hypothetical protein HPP92_012045 [Vanilla planifolia]